MLQLLWEQGVGKVLRTEEREQRSADLAKANAYQRSVALLKQQAED